jgi:signal transduction histidine kinase
MNRLADGDYQARLEYRGKLGRLPVVREIADSFNKMAAELENTELLRSDFINNFSHEFKTPIVSIAGFAKLLKKGTLTEEQRLLYLDAIEEESLRLSCMATNVLNLNKVESQSILTDLSRFNLSEQIRSVVLLTEEKWVEKNLDLQPEFDEYAIEANEEMLKQVWINLLDNAVKFTPRCGTVGISIREESDSIAVTVRNTGKEIPAEARDKIFHKFYQGEESHTHEGNGIGLAIVKRVVDLHGGAVTVESENGLTAFTVTLPKERGGNE